MTWPRVFAGPVSMTEGWVALLGKRDTPTDALEDYCRYLGGALEQQGISLELMRVNWAEKGWRGSLQEVSKKAKERPGSWFLLQYTALAWSQRGFPLHFPGLVRFLKDRAARCAVVFHDANPYAGSRMIDRMRRSLQIYAMRHALRLADLSVLTVPPEKIPWIPQGTRKVVFIPVGANFPSPDTAWQLEKRRAEGALTIAVFSVSEDCVGREEVKLVAEAIRYAENNGVKLRLAVLGRNSQEAGEQLKQELAGAKVQVFTHGLLKAEEIPRVLGACDVMLFTRGQISSRRSSAVAGIACGLPVIAQEGLETAAPVTEAGVVLLPAGARKEFGPALVRVLTNEAYRESLAEKSRRAQERYFSWTVISAQYAKSLSKNDGEYRSCFPRSQRAED